MLTTKLATHIHERNTNIALIIIEQVFGTIETLKPKIVKETLEEILPLVTADSWDELPL